MKGVYEIRNTVTGECYIGKAYSVEERWKQHRDTLREGRHFNHLLQAAWNAYGEAAFIFGVLEEIPNAAELSAREIELIVERTPAYNIAGTGRDSAARLIRAQARRDESEPPQKLWLHISEAARQLGVSTPVLRRRCEAGAFPGARFYGPHTGWRIPRSSLIAYLEDDKQ